MPIFEQIARRWQARTPVGYHAFYSARSRPPLTRGLFLAAVAHCVCGDDARNKAAALLRVTGASYGSQVWSPLFTQVRQNSMRLVVAIIFSRARLLMVVSLLELFPVVPPFTFLRGSFVIEKSFAPPPSQRAGLSRALQALLIEVNHTVTPTQQTQMR